MFSGLLIYNIWLQQGYNLLFTSMPICWYATFDWQYEKKYLMETPRTYEIGLHDESFNPFQFWKSYI